MVWDYLPVSDVTEVAAQPGRVSLWGFQWLGNACGNSFRHSAGGNL